MSRGKDISFIVERIGTLETRKVKLPVVVEIPRGQSIPVESTLLIRITMIVRVGRTREGLEIDPALQAELDLR